MPLEGARVTSFPDSPSVFGESLGTRLELESISQFFLREDVSRALQNYSHVFIFKALRIKDSDCLVISFTSERKFIPNYQLHVDSTLYYT